MLVYVVRTLSRGNYTIMVHGELCLLVRDQKFIATNFNVYFIEEEVWLSEEKEIRIGFFLCVVVKSGFFLLTSDIMAPSQLVNGSYFQMLLQVFSPLVVEIYSRAYFPSLCCFCWLSGSEDSLFWLGKYTRSKYKYALNHLQCKQSKAGVS